jgi:DNA-binding Lrp family transcriptional regulator
MAQEILYYLENNAKLSAAELAVLTGQSESEVADEIARLEADGVVCGYYTLINWEKAEREHVTALIEVKVKPERGKGYDKIAERIYRFDEVQSVYLMSGGYDIMVLVDGKSMKDIAYFVSYKLSTLESVHSVATHFVLKKYMEHGVVIDGEAADDERLIVSP